ncbi:MAG: HU family DNA-binding protein [Bdellovibrionales bacterium]|nr:HU family DNA-binding protein [Bdellovibrionales bacterium]
MARKKAAAKKRNTTARKSTARKPAAKKPARKVAAKKKTAAKKKPAAKKKTAAKKSPARKAAPKKQAAAKKAPAVKAAPAPAKKIRASISPKNKSTLSYTQSEFLENLRGFCGLEKRSQAKELWADISLFITDSLKRGYRIPLAGLGKMYVRKSKARMGRNPATGEIIHIAAKKRVRFTAAKALKDSVLS